MTDSHQQHIQPYYSHCLESECTEIKAKIFKTKQNKTRDTNTNKIKTFPLTCLFRHFSFRFTFISTITKHIRNTFSFSHFQVFW